MNTDRPVYFYFRANGKRFGEEGFRVVASHVRKSSHSWVPVVDSGRERTPLPLGQASGLAYRNVDVTVMQRGLSKKDANAVVAVLSRMNPPPERTLLGIASTDVQAGESFVDEKPRLRRMVECFTETISGGPKA